MSNIRVFVHWKSSAVFAGEDIECEIIFKNTSQVSSSRRTPSQSPQVWSAASGRERWKESLSPQSPQLSFGHSHNTSLSTSQAGPPKITAHRSALSLNSSTAQRNEVAANFSNTALREVNACPQNHKRSVSIVSIGGEASAPNEKYLQAQPLGLKRPGRGHARAASLQVLTDKIGVEPGLLASPPSARVTGTAHLFRASSFVAEQPFGTKSPTGRFMGSNSLTIQRKASASLYSSFRFPQTTASMTEVTRAGPGDALTGPFTPRPHANESTNGTESLNPITRILSPTSMNGSPRSSVELYATSNNSTETLASEYVTRNPRWQSQNGAESRRSSVLGPLKTEKVAETLIMGYGQITGSFILDASLVNQAPFEEVKRKGIIGSHGGGGVVRAEASKRDGGLFSGLGWGSIGGSLGGLLGSNELSTIKTTKDSASMRSIPILSTPQSVLFVDLQLGPGESRSYTYSHRLPSGIPPTHKGRAMKVSYNLTIGTQRAVKNTIQHHIRTVDIPFRVLTGVDSQGTILSHDLMSPYVLLHSDACVLKNRDRPKDQIFPASTSIFSNSGSAQDFLSYVDATLSKNDQVASLLSPTDIIQSSPAAASDASTPVQEAIELALLRSNSTPSTRRSANRFEITRGGDRVAVILLTRPAYRLGEAISVAIDFQDSEVSCYSLHTTLESSEVIDAAIALRSNTSIQRVTRRIHASESLCTIFARRATFHPIIPTNTTPEFVTSGISLEWVLRFEFVTSRSTPGTEKSEKEGLLEEVAKDERNSVMAAVQGISCEIFDVTVPLRVYGARSAFDEKTEAGNFQI